MAVPVHASRGQCVSSRDDLLELSCLVFHNYDIFGSCFKKQEKKPSFHSIIKMH